MAAILNIFSDPACTVPGQALVPGAAAFLGETADISNWAQQNGIPYKNNVTPAEIVFSGGAVLYDYAIPQGLPVEGAENTAFDWTTQQQTAKIWNPFFMGSEGNTAYCLSISCISPETTPQYILRIYSYVQSPENLEGSRTSWEYTQVLALGGNQFYETPFSSLKVYRGTISEQEFYIVAINVKSDNETDAGLTRLVALPVAFFNGRIPEPYIGETAEDDSETAFLPPDGGEWHDAITTRTNYDVNPYGVNQRGGIKVIFPTVSSDGTIYPIALQFIINGIYRGYSESVLNQLGQVIADITGGNANRPAEEVQAILSAILSLHSVPVIYPSGTAGSYAQMQTTFNTISGYDITGIHLPLTSPGQKTIFEWVYTTDLISRRLNCFLDFEPFTTITLKLPFFPPVSLTPSAVFGHRLQVDYKIDIMTGLLSADVSTTDDGGTYYILTTMQGNVKTAIPIMGQGAQNAVLEKITGAIVSTATRGTVGAITGAFTMADELSKASHGVVVGDMSVDGLGAYLSPRAAYIICSHPVAAIPASYDAQGAIIGDFIDTVGMAANLGGKVGDFSGGFASFSAVDLSGVPCTDEEKREILRRLTEGVYL